MVLEPNPHRDTALKIGEQIVAEEMQNSKSRLKVLLP